MRFIFHAKKDGGKPPSFWIALFRSELVGQLYFGEV
ncbi:hypothetical protein Q604_UNBC04664G0001, partial [human gut metagenome]